MYSSLIRNKTKFLLPSETSLPDLLAGGHKKRRAMQTTRTDKAFTEEVGCFFCQQELRELCTKVHRATQFKWQWLCVSGSVILFKPEIKAIEVDSGTVERDN